MDFIIIAHIVKECKRTSTGDEYIGHLQHTFDGKQCVLWEEVESELQYVNDAAFPDNSVKAAKNYCRNPLLHKTGPWCFTDIAQKHWGFCNISYCGMYMLMFGDCLTIYLTITLTLFSFT